MICHLDKLTITIIIIILHISDSISDKVLRLKVMGDCLQGLQAHDELLLLKHAFTIPKLLYTL